MPEREHDPRRIDAYQDKGNVLLTNKVIPFILKGEVTALHSFSIKKASAANG